MPEWYKTTWYTDNVLAIIKIGKNNCYFNSNFNVIDILNQAYYIFWDWFSHLLHEQLNVLISIFRTSKSPQFWTCIHSLLNISNKLKICWKWTHNKTCVSQFSSVAQSCPTFCYPMDCSMPGLPVHHQLLEFT